MKVLTHSDAYQVLLLQAADEGRGPVLFGESFARARSSVLPFLIGKKFPSVYLEFPLIGDPFLDVTVLYNKLDPGMRIASPAAGDHGAMLDWFAEASKMYDNISSGFELDTKEPVLPEAAVHYQPRGRIDTVRPFCEAVGEPERADLYLDLAARMPEGWPLSFFGMFRGRPGSPLRVCGYLDSDERDVCARDSQYLAERFNAIGFSAYDDAMLAQVSALMATVPKSVDFQFDVHPDGRLGSTFAIDAQFGIDQPEAVCAAFDDGPSGRVMRRLEEWGAADARWKLGVEAVFARALPVELDDGSAGRYGLTLMPQWVKARWANRVLQPSKLYLLASADLFD